MKQFTFQVHPDYFNNYKTLQSVNAANLMLLQSIVDQVFLQGNSKEKIISSEGLSGARSLTFYVKAPEFEDCGGGNKIDSRIRPGRVKVSLHRVLLSVEEILETIGIALPQRPPGVLAIEGHGGSSSEGGGFSSAIVLAEPEQVLEFVESIAERRELIRWRRRRLVTLQQQEQVKQHGRELSL